MLQRMPSTGGPPVQPKWGRLLQERREARKWSLRWAAQQAGLSDVFWAQMERGWKRADGGRYVEVTPSLGSLLQAAAALRMAEHETDELIVAAGHPPLPRRYADGARPVSFRDAVESDPHLLDEAKEHLLKQYALLRRLSPAAATTDEQAVPQPAQRPLRAVARRRPPKP